MCAVNEIIKALNNFFAEQDQKIEESNVTWAMGRVAALKEFKASDKYKELNAKGEFGGKYPALYAIAGGKTWYQLFAYSNKSGIEEFVRKNAKAVVAKRNAKIAAKLTAAGVTEVVTASVDYCTDGFNGLFTVNGNRTVRIESIVAGGYNIQRLHQRVLINVK